MTLRERIANVLDYSPIPVRTEDLILLTIPGKRRRRDLVWQALTKMLAAGQVRKIVGRNHHLGQPVAWVSTYWDQNQQRNSA